MEKTPREIAKQWFRKLPPHVQDGLRMVRAGGQKMLAPPPAQRPATFDPASLALPFRITPAAFGRWVEVYRTLPDGPARQDAIVAAMDHVALHPDCFRLLINEYASSKFRGEVLYEYARAAYEHGSGDCTAAFARLSELERRSPSPFTSLAAARSLLRPPGREREALAYLQGRLAAFPGDLPLASNYAAMLFAVGQVDEANRAIAPVVDKYKAAVEPEQRDKFTKASEALARAIEQKIADRLVFEDSAYFEENIEKIWETYFCYMIGHPPHLMFGWLNGLFRDRLSGLASHGGAPKVFNFGVMCAQPDYEAALRHPQARFIGVDTQQQTAQLNRMAYGAAPNMEFIAGDIEEVLPRMVKPGDESALFHARTATLLYPDRLRNLYRLCASLGVRRIALFENYSISHDYYRFFDFASMPRISMIYKNWQFIHNYQRLLEEAGYEITSKEVYPSPLITPHWTMEYGSTHVFLDAKLR